MFGAHPSAATIVGGKLSAPTPASTSPPPVWMSSARVAAARRSRSRRWYPHDGRSSVARPSSHPKSHPSTDAASASFNSESNERAIVPVQQFVSASTRRFRVRAPIALIRHNATPIGRYGATPPPLPFASAELALERPMSTAEHATDRPRNDRIEQSEARVDLYRVSYDAAGRIVEQGPFVPPDAVPPSRRRLTEATAIRQRDQLDPVAVDGDDSEQQLPTNRSAVAPQFGVERRATGRVRHPDERCDLAVDARDRRHRGPYVRAVGPHRHFRGQPHRASLAANTIAAVVARAALVLPDALESPQRGVLIPRLVP